MGRRFQRYGELLTLSGAHFSLIDDYGHHPAELEAVIEAARGAFPQRRLVLAFQPHRYTRTRDCFADFVRVLSQADAVLLSDVYGAGEPPIAGADAIAMAGAMQSGGFRAVSCVGAIQQMASAITTEAREGDVVITLGAGSMGAVPAQVLNLCAGAGLGAGMCAGTGTT